MSELIGPPASVFNRDVLNRDEMLLLDRLAAAAWPAPVQENLDGWSLRFGDGVTRRANSVAPWPLEAGARPMEQLLYTAQTFYQEHGLPPRFQISPAAQPDAIDEILASNDFEIEAPVTVQIANANALAPDRDGPSRVTLHTSATDGWWDLYIKGFGRDARDIVAASKDAPLFAVAADDKGTPIAIGLGVFGGGWLGIFAMWTEPDWRGGGLGTSTIRAFAKATIDRGGHGLYLQVENHNSDAKRLYEHLGFRAVYGYYYRTQWT